MSDGAAHSLRALVTDWTCNQFAITDHEGDTAALLRRLADSIEGLGPINILDITYTRPSDPSIKEITATVYFTLAEEG
ncbi:hypothetical protein [Frankia sp. QA3]|uniref:hypothetical protein n=1 Tax=Frankia sp. QA3 TaxID=710111 RepID=UPI000269BEC8|nr:hypothetical protein [Frankia sp. QA3]EIV91909.1 hypothetical protein FraQA3DRAFT_1394 [Frankia sp. QA3]